MARRPSKHLRAPRPLASAAFARSDDKTDGRWVVQALPAGRSDKAYLCPGCNRRVEVGAAHIVAWPHQPGVASTSAVDDRRHWHTACWQRRA